MRKTIDWDEVKARMKKTSLATDNERGRDAERMTKIFADRADRLARRAVAAESVEEGIRVLGFQLGDAPCAIDTVEIVEIIPLSHYTPVPFAPDGLLGVFNLRGDILPLVDLARVFSLAPGDGDASSGYILVLRRIQVGLKVGQVQQMRQLLRADTSSDMPLTSGKGARYVKSIARDATMLLDMDAILTHAVFSAE